SGAATAFIARLNGRRKARFKWVAVEQNNTFDRAAQYYPCLRMLEYWNQFTQLIYAEADAVIAVSQGVRRGLEEHYSCDGGKIAVVPNPVRYSGVAASEPIERDRPFVLAAGRLHPQKRFEHLITAFSMISSEVDVDLVI